MRLDGGQFTMSVLSGILWFKVTERYPLDGAPVQCRRRDLRRGGSPRGELAGGTAGRLAGRLAGCSPPGSGGEPRACLPGAPARGGACGCGACWPPACSRGSSGTGRSPWLRAPPRAPCAGGHTGRVERCPATGSVVLRLEWGEPLGGTGVDTFWLAEPGAHHALVWPGCHAGQCGVINSAELSTAVLGCPRAGMRRPQCADATAPTLPPPLPACLPRCCPQMCCTCAPTS